MTDDADGPSGGAPPDDVVDALGEALGGRETGRGNAMSRGTHGTVTGDDDVDFDLASCDLVAQTFDPEADHGTRLYRVADETYALSRYRRSVSGEWAETLVAHGEVGVEPAALDEDAVQDAVLAHGAAPLEPDELAFVSATYAETCEAAVADAIARPAATEGLTLRGQLACVEDHGWRETVGPLLADRLDDAQVEAVLDGLMDARPDVDWTWCQLYAVYVARLRFDGGGSDTGTDEGTG